MSNYICTVRSNYFHVKDPASFRDFMSRVYGSEDRISLWQEQDEEGRLVFGFGSYGAIAGLKNAGADDDDLLDETAYDEFIRGLQEHVAENDAVILMETGHEKLCYVTGAATILTSSGQEYLSLAELAAKRASEMLENPGWSTQCDY
ncbi:hypothetical protein [Pseudoflavonifractor phocaeensis]|uniref:hypothetical protein n=1 Tax=Pseudoflavonifractor phocaeensis TaxID=1870988 RepID=UPI0019560634|nr:hypothetical protein [Pseudoflavonifractor phocaeensis]MBM6886531.1 hypothetical protein [Pseudoflavonifractor phocaeensis]